jgi:hypothetical protein
VLPDPLVMEALILSPGETDPIVTAGLGKSSYHSEYEVTPPCVNCAVPVWMIELGELGLPSIPIQVADASRSDVGWIVGTTQSAATRLKVDPPAIWPDQLNDSFGNARPFTWGSDGVTERSGLVWGWAEETGVACPNSAHET